ELNDQLMEIKNLNQQKEIEIQELLQKNEALEKTNKKLKKSKINNDNQDEIVSESEDEVVNINEILDPIKLKADEDPSFGIPKNVSKWSTEEVSFWLYRIQMEDYVPKFLKIQIDGNILINDVDEKWLKIDLKIKPLHINKILRE